jgi:hypothetical protein
MSPGWSRQLHLSQYPRVHNKSRQVVAKDEVETLVETHRLGSRASFLDGQATVAEPMGAARKSSKLRAGRTGQVAPEDVANVGDRPMTLRGRRQDYRCH